MLKAVFEEIERGLAEETSGAVDRSPAMLARNELRPGRDKLLAVAGLVRRGLPAARYDALLGFLDVTSKQLSEVIGMVPSMLSRRRERGHFDKGEPERLLRLGRLVGHAADVQGFTACLGGPGGFEPSTFRV